MKSLGVERILSASAVGSLQETICAARHGNTGSVFDRTRGRVKESTFFGEGIVAHVSFAHPVCAGLGDVLEESCATADVKFIEEERISAWKGRHSRRSPNQTFIAPGEWTSLG
jgi:purine nucleoside phosphorylase